MSYNKEQFKTYINTAGKISILTALVGVVAFSFIFLLNIGAKEFKQAGAQGVATTSVIVLNTPPVFLAGPFETPESSTTTPTNAGDNVTWTAVAEDSNAEDYFLLICDGETASPTARPLHHPICGAGDMMWAVSATTSSGNLATAATTTTDAFQENNDWFAWVCDAVAISPRCNPYAQQGTGSTSSPFNVNHRPNFDGYWNTSPADPGVTFTFHATSSDDDFVGGVDTVQLHVCSTPFFNTVTDTCTAQTLATSTFVVENPTASFTIGVPFQDDDYDAYGFIIDNHGFEAAGVFQGTTSLWTVNNVAPTINAAQLTLNGGQDMILTNEGGETTGFTLSFEASDNNSCDAVGGNTYDEITDFYLSVYRSGVGTTTCDGSAGAYDPNNCYPSGVASTTWNLACTASTTSCTFQDDGIDTTMRFDCTFPLWFVADPTDGTATNTFFFNEDWRMAVAAIDDDGATSTYVQSSAANINVRSLLAFNLLDTNIFYGSIEPDQDTGFLNSSTTAQSTGNTGLNHGISGESMCQGYTSGNPCFTSSTSTIGDLFQQYATSAVAYGDGTPLSSSTPPAEFEIGIPKSTSTVALAEKDTFWGIAIPGTLTLAGTYTGENTLTAVVSHPDFWY